MKRSIAPFIAITALVVLSLACGSQSVTPSVVSTAPSTLTVPAAVEISSFTPAPPTPIPTATSKPKATPLPKLIVPAGELNQYYDTYWDYEIVNVIRRDGTLETIRNNDLEELALDWFFYRDRIIKFTAQGETEKADEARVAWNDINRWLDEYNEDDVGAMFTIIENRKK